MAVPPRLGLAETVDNVAPSTAGCSWTDGKALSTYQIFNPGIDDLAPTITDILGTTQLDVYNGGLHRSLPLCHPAFQFWYASAITDIQGVGKYTKTRIPNNGGLETPPISGNYALYPIYNYKVQFTPRPYALLKDQRINVVTSIWIDEQNVTRDYLFAEEWLRYTDYAEEPIEDSVTATQGEMIYRDVPTFFGFGAPRYSGMPRMYLNNSMVTLSWYQVPYRYITSPKSFLKKYRGRVNQTEFFNWLPGELLYLGYKTPRRYTPPVPHLDQLPDADDPFEGLGVFSTQKFVDIELKFLGTKRQYAPAKPYVPTNKNFLASGHNVLPWAADRSFHYCTSYNRADENNQNQWVPSWLSAPFQILQTDPDFPQP